MWLCIEILMPACYCLFSSRYLWMAGIKWGTHLDLPKKWKAVKGKLTQLITLAQHRWLLVPCIYVSQFYVSRTWTNVLMLEFCVPMSSWSPRTKIREWELSVILENPGTETGFSGGFKGERNVSGILTPGRRDSSRTFLLEWKWGGRIKNKGYSFKQWCGWEIGRSTPWVPVMSSVLVVVIGAVGGHSDPV